MLNTYCVPGLDLGAGVATVSSRAVELMREVNTRRR